MGDRETKAMSLVAHLKELRKVLIISAYAILIATVVGFFLTDPLFGYLTRPLQLLGSRATFVTMTVTEPIMVKLKVSVLAGILMSLPVVVWQLWSFILPALKKNERKYVYIIAPVSILLFFAGVAFAFYFALPVGLKVLLFIQSGVAYQPLVTQSSYFGFLLGFLLTFGLVFELPVVLLALVRLGVITPQFLSKNRKYAIFIIAIISAIAPPVQDLFSLLLFAGPMYLLYEVSIWLSYLVVRRRNKALQQR
ncbi:MAG: twin-arginine translocase subunit TatC [Peptococcaceae bacterium]|nr:twin-arginine translocase subunit TatC [Peptococcaceae bacterium]